MTIPTQCDDPVPHGPHIVPADPGALFTRDFVCYGNPPEVNHTHDVTTLGTGAVRLAEATSPPPHAHTGTHHLHATVDFVGDLAADWLAVFQQAVSATGGAHSSIVIYAVRDA
jgi:hypothetical protein